MFTIIDSFIKALCINKKNMKIKRKTLGALFTIFLLCQIFPIIIKVEYKRENMLFPTERSFHPFRSVCFSKENSQVDYQHYITVFGRFRYWDNMGEEHPLVGA